MNQTLGRLERVDLRSVWVSENVDFTPWLAREDNLAILSDTLQIDLELEAQERNVGPFRADILCRDTTDGAWVLIENQLERTDHTHLGQLMTYAAGLHAVTIVWIAARFTDEHRAALDWLNEITDETFRFFGLEIELWRIGDSVAAPKFNVVCKPNDWSRTIASAASRVAEGELSETRQLQLRFWQGFADHVRQVDTPLGVRKAHPQSWYEMGIGKTGYMIWLSMNLAGNKIWASVYWNHKNAKKSFDLLAQDREAIEREYGSGLTWDRLDNRKGCMVSIEKGDLDLTNETAWSAHHDWLLDQAERFYRSFSARIRALNEDDWTEDLTQEGLLP